MKTNRLIIVLTASAALMLAACNNDNGGQPKTTYTVTVTSAGNGEVVAEPAEAVEGQTVTITATPVQGYLFAQWTVISGGITPDDPAASRTTFTMPAANVSIQGKFEEDIDVFTQLFDVNFKEYCRRFDINEDGKLSIDEVKIVTTIDVTHLKIASLMGIEYFTFLEKLTCTDNNLIVLDMSGNTALTYLACEFNKIGNLNVSKNIALTTLSCSSNQLSTLDVSKNTALKSLGCANNLLSSIDISAQTSLSWLACYDNWMTSLDASNMIFSELGRYTVYCGRQSNNATLTLILPENMKPYWATNLKENELNTNVVLAD